MQLLRVAADTSAPYFSLTLPRIECGGVSVPSCLEGLGGVVAALGLEQIRAIRVEALLAEKAANDPIWIGVDASNNVGAQSSGIRNGSPSLKEGIQPSH